MTDKDKKRAEEAMNSERIEIGQPLIIMFEQDDSIICHLYPRNDDTYKGYGLMICDLIRHVAAAFSVDEDDVFKWVEREYRKPTTTINWPS